MVKEYVYPIILLIESQLPNNHRSYKMEINLISKGVSTGFFNDNTYSPIFEQTSKNASNKVGNKTVPACRVHIWIAKKDRFSRSTYPWQHLDTVTLFIFPQFLWESRSCSLGLIVHISVLRWTDVFKQLLWERFREISFWNSRLQQQNESWKNAFCVQQNRHLFLTLSLWRELCP